MLLVVATTEATDPTRVSVSFRINRQRLGVLSVRLRDANPWGQWNLGSVSLGEGGMRYGC